MKKIVYLLDSLEIGGAEELLFTTLKYINREEYEAYVFSIQDKGELAPEIESLGFKVVFLGSNSELLDVRLIPKLVRLFRKIRPDIVHTHSFYPGLHGRISAFLSGVPVNIITEHGTGSSKKKALHKLIDRFLAKITSKIIAVSESVKEYLSRECGIPAKDIAVINNTIDPNKFSVKDSRQTLRSRFGFDGSQIIIGNVGSLAPWKGQIYLIQALPEVLRNGDNVRLLIIGADPVGYKNILAAEARRLGVSENITILGKSREIPQLLNIMDIFVFPSLSEGFGIAVLEAMYMGLPIVATAVEGLREVLTDGKTGILVPPRDPVALAGGILSLIRDKETALRIGKQAKQRVIDEFGPQKYISSLEGLYSELCVKGGGR